MPQPSRNRPPLPVRIATWRRRIVAGSLGLFLAAWLAVFGLGRQSASTAAGTTAASQSTTTQAQSSGSPSQADASQTGTTQSDPTQSDSSQSSSSQDDMSSASTRQS